VTLAAFGAGAFGAVPANAAPTAAVAGAAAKNKNTMRTTHLTIKAATEAPEAP
jgi:hypothetical protein